jgi:glutamyl/glutaminyl-tRNA synthetase
MIKTFEEDGVLPEALNNYVALYGWSPKTKSEVLSMDQLIARVSLFGKFALTISFP